MDAKSARSMGASLCVFAIRWELDGDIVRCKSCNRGQHTAYADTAFNHAYDCRARETSIKYPWRALVQILRPLYSHVANTPEPKPESLT